MPAHVKKRKGYDYGYDVVVDGQEEWFASDKKAYKIAKKVASIEKRGGKIKSDDDYGWRIDGNRWIGSLKDL